MSFTPLSLGLGDARRLIDRQIPATPIAARELTRMIRACLAADADIPTAAAEDAALIMHELIANVVAHARARSMRVTLTLMQGVDVLAGVVQDDGAGVIVLPPPNPGELPDLESESGRGLAIVSALADACSATRFRNGKAVRWGLRLGVAEPSPLPPFRGIVPARRLVDGTADPRRPISVEDAGYLWIHEAQTLASDVLGALDPGDRLEVFRAVADDLPPSARSTLARDLLATLASDERAAALSSFGIRSD
ncbi:MAG TPA: ATP-binding protein [Ramlibacter sp.]